MGGEAAKERRRLKRLGVEAPSGEKPNTPGPKATSKSIDKKSGAPNQTKGNGGENKVDDTRVRLQRKMARQASGAFKPNPNPQPKEYKRKTYDDDGKASKFEPRPPSKTFKGSSRDDSFQRNGNDSFQRKGNDSFQRKGNDSFQRKGNDSFQRKGNDSFQHKTPTNNKFRNQKDKEKQPFKKIQKVKKPKPKHLKRKMGQLSKTISEGNGETGTNVSDLEGQMKTLVEQMEKYKKMKENNVAKTDEKAVVKPKEDGRTGKDSVDVAAVAVNDAIQGGKEVKVQKKAKENKVAKTDEIAMVESKEDVHTGKDDTDENAMAVDDAIQAGKEDETDIKENEEADSSPSGHEEPSKSDEKQTKESSPSSSSSNSSSDNNSDDDSDDDSDGDDIADASNGRSRGKRGKGRRENQPKAQEKTPDVEETEPSKKTSKKDDKRRCVGRKAITDYIIGKTYSGTVRYIKPKLGAFIDIGSHSDAFCHISCVSNEYVSSVADAVKVNDVVENVRVVEINREKKRITVSLRSEEMAENETERLKTTRQYENRNRPPRTYNNDRNGDAKNGPAKPGYVRFDGSESKANAHSENKVTNNEDGPPVLNSNSTKFNAEPKTEPKLAGRDERRVEKEQWGNSPADDWNKPQWQSTGQNSGADLKRERKLARRAERRAATEAGN